MKRSKKHESAIYLCKAVMLWAGMNALVVAIVALAIGGTYGM